MKTLNDPAEIVLVSTYELGHQPLALASALGFLERAGYSAVAIDLAVERFDPARFAQARFVAISVPMHTALRLGVRAAARIRELNPDCHICYFGLYAALNAEHLRRAHAASSVIAGELEPTLVALVQAVEAGIDTPIADSIVERIELVVPSRSGLPPLEKYARLHRDGALETVGYVEASRGCKHRCLHCPIPPIYAGRFFTVPRDVVLEDVRRLVAMGAKHITFGDPDFLNGPGHALRIVREMHAEQSGLTYDFTAKIEHIFAHGELFPEFRRTGCLFVVSAVESLSDRVLANLDKGHDRSDVFRALALVRDAGIALRPSLVSFTPWTTLEDYLDVLDVVEREDLIDHVDPVQYSIRLLVPPGSLLLEKPAIQPFLGPLDAEAFSYRWEHPDPRMDALQRVVARIVQEAGKRSEDPALTFRRVRAAALSIRDAREHLVDLGDIDGWPRERYRPPRLTESWFC